MTQALVLTFIARDRPGLIDRLSTAVAEAGGNWLESRMVHLAEQFAGIARIEVPAAGRARIKAALAALEKEGFHIAVEDAGGAPPATGRILVLDLIGADHPGIVREISHCLAGRGIGIEEMESDIRTAPMSGEALFAAKVRARVPPEIDDKDLADALHVLGASLMVDIALAPGGE